MVWRRKFSLLLAAFALMACGARPPEKPDVPASVSPGWKLSSLEKSARPSEVAAQGEPQCWKASYSGSGQVDTWICWYNVSSAAFDAVQRTRAEAQTVKFQEGQWFVLLKWNNTSRTDVTALIRAVQKALHSGA